MSRPERSTHELMQQYWAACRARGEPRRKVYGLVAIKATTDHLKGHVLTWGVGRKYVEMLHARRGDPDAWEIMEFEPNV